PRSLAGMTRSRSIASPRANGEGGGPGGASTRRAKIPRTASERRTLILGLRHRCLSPFAPWGRGAGGEGREGVPSTECPVPSTEYRVRRTAPALLRIQYSVLGTRSAPSPRPLSPTGREQKDCG